MDAPAAGDVSVTVGNWLAAPVTVTDTPLLGTVEPMLSVACAVSVRVPAVVGVQVMEYGGAVRSPIVVEPSKKRTRWIVPSGSDAGAASVTVVPATIVEPPDGEGSVLVGARFGVASAR